NSFAWGKVQRSRAIVVLLTGQKLLYWRVSEIARREYMRDGRAGQISYASAFSQGSFDERPMAPRQLAKPTQCINHTGSVRRTARRRGGEPHHCHLSALGRPEGEFANLAIGNTHILAFHILNPHVRWKAILCQTNASRFELRAGLLVLDPVKTVLIQKSG